MEVLVAGWMVLGVEGRVWVGWSCVMRWCGCQVRFGDGGGGWGTDPSEGCWRVRGCQESLVARACFLWALQGAWDNIRYTRYINAILIGVMVDVKTWIKTSRPVITVDDLLHTCVVGEWSKPAW